MISTEPTHDHQELQLFLRRNKDLRRQLREKDARIMELFECIGRANSTIVASTPHSHSHRANPTSPHRSLKIAHSEAKREKRSREASNESPNIFKQQSSSLIGVESGRELRLPVLQRRPQFQLVYPREDAVVENPEGRARLVRIPLDRLKPLNSKEVKKRFLLKFQRRQQDALPL